jgi:pSer/pThr/pTyr-binding forkhead associated (FHA) protein
MIAEGFSSSDAKRLGFEQHDVTVDHGDGRGPVVAQADFLAGLIEVLIGGRLRRRICSEFDQEGKEYWVRQIAVGHENDPEVGWVVVQVPDFKTFDPIEAGLLPAGTDPGSPEFFASYQQLIYDYYIKQAADILDIPRHELRRVQMIYGPTLFSLIERVGDDALIAANGVVAGDSFGNGHFLTSGGAMTGMIGHSARVLEYWRARDAGTSPAAAIRRLADRIREDTHAWLQVSAKEYSQAVPINFGAQRIEQINKASGFDPSARANVIDAARRQRHALLPLDPSNWRRLFVRNGRVLSALPELDETHPLQRAEHVASLLAVMKAFPVTAGQVNSPPSTQQELKEGEKTLLRPKPSTEQELKEGEKTLLRPKPSTEQELKEGEKTLLRPILSMGAVAPESAKIYAVLEIKQNEGAVQRITIKENAVLVGRADPKRGITPGIDLTPFDPSISVSRQHARIHLEKNCFYIEDLNSRNKTRLGESVLTPRKPEVLHNGDVINFGSVKATFRLLGTSELPEAWSPS